MMKRISSYWKKSWKSKMWTILVGLTILFLIFFFRDEYQPLLLFLRKYILVEIIFLGVVALTVYKFRKAATPMKRVIVLTCAIAFFVLSYFAYPWYTYCQDYYLFTQLNKQEIHALPLTQQERIQPQNNIRTLAYEAVTETQEVSDPHLVRVDDQNHWTMAIQPAHEYGWQRMVDEIEEIFSVSSTAPFPSFAEENRVEITFSIGESLRFSRNTYNACVMGFNFWQLWTLEPDQVYYIKNDQGDWVQVVSLIRWKGFLFPYPTFGGVMVIESGQHTFSDYLERVFVGKGIYIAPDEMDAYAYLQGQNIMSEKVTRTYAKTLKFLGGFWDPMPHRRKTAVKIPDLLLDQSQQPFVTDFDFSDVTHEQGANPPSGLYHYFGLEPIGMDRTGLAISVFIPADGHGEVYYYHHSKKKEGLAGVSAMPTKVKESRMEYDWGANAPVEFRPYIRDMAGDRRFFWLTTVVVLRTEANQFDGSATPQMVVIDALYKDVVWLNSAKPSTWESKIVDHMQEAWTRN